MLEPAWLASGECDAQHVAFALACLAPLRETLAARGLPLWVRIGKMPAVLQALRLEFGFTHLFSHEETGPGWSYARDLAVAAWCKAQGVVFSEWPQTGVVRRLKDRRGWAARWAARMNSQQIGTPAVWRGAAVPEATPLPTLADLGLPPPRPLPPAGEAAAQALLADFVGGRASGYRRALSSPLTAAEGCSRLSPHLAFGSVSMRQVHQATEAVIASTSDRSLAHGLRGFAGRLRWHCHFMQKLEDQPEIEVQNFSRVHDGCAKTLSTANGSKPGVPAAPVSRWSMPACASCTPPAG